MKKRSSRHPARAVATKNSYYEIEFWPWIDSEGVEHDTGLVYVFAENMIKAAISASFTQMRLYQNIGIKQITNKFTGEVFKGKLDLISL